MIEAKGATISWANVRHSGFESRGDFRERYKSGKNIFGSKGRIQKAHIVSSTN